MPKSKTVDVLPIFRTQRQAELLRLLLLQPDRQYKGIELAEILREKDTTVYRELRRLVAGGLIKEQGLATAKLYSAATDSPFYDHLRALVELSLGVEAELRRRLSEIDGVEVAAIFGSWARAERLRPTSDVDVLIIGTADYAQVADAADAVERLIGREVQLVPYTWAELDERIADDSAFVNNVLRGPLKMLVGDAERLKERIKND